jgi:hypothetical protein
VTIDKPHLPVYRAGQRHRCTGMSQARMPYAPIWYKSCWCSCKAAVNWSSPAVCVLADTSTLVSVAGNKAERATGTTRVS